MLRPLLISMACAASLMAALPAAAQSSSQVQPQTDSPAPTAPVPPIAPAAAAVEGDPAATVRWFYPLRPETAPAPFSQRLQKLQDLAIANSRKLNAPVSGIDFAFQVNAQDTEPGYEKSLRIIVRRNDGKRARVRVSLRNFRNVELVFELVPENGKWVVDEVRSIREPRWVLSRLLITGAREK